MEELKPRFIDAEWLKLSILNIEDEAARNKRTDAIPWLTLMRAAIDLCPTADVEEVKHGKWMDGKYFPFIPKKGTQGFQTATCSRCNITQSVNTYQEKVKFNYCPYCGAKMDGKENEDAEIH